MAAALTHARSSVKNWGGRVEDYLAVHLWFDESKGHFGDFRHRALRHHTLGILECEAKFGVSLVQTGDDGQPIKSIPTRWVAEQHLREDFGRLPSVQDWLECIQPAPWMTRSRRLSDELDEAAA